ncbi:MAG: hypothetical protein DID90_2727553204 [Candidatus Nitrotoga sp. LAW]|nr:MAG: hypothetical protein DID90_2727553204 [Candidatus Nitrotoga sp. LAW]
MVLNPPNEVATTTVTYHSDFGKSVDGGCNNFCVNGLLAVYKKFEDLGKH